MIHKLIEIGQTGHHDFGRRQLETLHCPYTVIWIMHQPDNHRWPQLDQWEGFDIFEVARLSRGRPLQTVALAALQHFGLVDKLGLPLAQLSAFLQVCSPGGKPVTDRTVVNSTPPAIGDIRPFISNF